MSRFWSDIVHRLIPYTPGEQPVLAHPVKLNTNENPYGPSPRVLEAIKAELGDHADALRRYPDPTARTLCETIARHLGVRAGQVFVGNGSDEVLAHVFQGLLRHAHPILFADITYSFYPTYARLFEIDYRLIPLEADFSLDVDAYRQPNGGILIANPNAPTGRALSLKSLERLLDANPDSVVVIDEAYVDFGAESAVGLIDRYPQLLVVQTLSKSRSLAGMRVGYAIGHRDLIDALTRVKDSFNSYPLDRLAQVGAIAAIEDVAWFDKTRQAVMASRETLSAQLEALGFRVLPSAANFVFATHPDEDAGAIAAALREREIFVRHFRLPRIEQFLRISIGTDAECAALVTALKERARVTE
ncbi:histidinol-phosphate transaminase [Pararobbsia alpina]|uniref:Histidinol-phosphate aminotransferase n=1 Tax=Pararobbsia alpina TaxID=621374 RepID=A0A6S7B5G9_9BURK|nr:histidinol-phosphate transaminase [Pararobbsia alpina]CAB3788418.1 Histidinol-phosphate aminotransferase [Pararobbsia alpina]